MEDVVQALELARPLQGEDVEWFLDDAEPSLVPSRIAADRAGGLIADVEAALAEHHFVAHVDQGRGERAGFRVGSAKQVVRQPLGGLGTDARQARE